MASVERREAFRPLRLVRAAAGETVGRERGEGEFRQLVLRTGAIAKASGSAYLELGESKVLTTVSGPQQAEGSTFLSHGRLECTVGFSAFCTTEETPADGFALSALLVTALSPSVRLDQYPKSIICVNVMVLQDAGGILGAAVCCASLALAHAGIELYGLVASCSCALGADARVLIDPSATEEREAAGIVSAATMPELSQVTLCLEEGRVTFDAMSDGLRCVLDGCAQLHERMKAALIEEPRSSSQLLKRKRCVSDRASISDDMDGARKPKPKTT